MKNISDKFVEKIKNSILCIIFFFSENRTVYETMWKNAVEPDRPPMTTYGTRITCWIPKATNTHSEYVILVAFPLQQWLRKRS